MNKNNQNEKNTIKKNKENISGGIGMKEKNNAGNKSLEQAKVDSEFNSETVEVEGLEIRGITHQTKLVKKNKEKSVDRRQTKSFKIDEFIYRNYQVNEEFVISEMSRYLRQQGFETKDISGQMHAKKVSGLLSNRKPTEEEARIIGKGVSVWKASQKFYEKLEAELDCYKKLDTEAKTDNKPKLK